MAIKELRVICQASAPAPENESLVGRFCRIFSIYCTAFFLKIPITPNQITAISSLVFFAGLALLFSSIYWVTVLGALVVIFSVVLDGADGEVARFRKSTKISGGAYAEPVSHDVQYGFMFLLLGTAVWYQGGGVLYLALGAITSIAKLLYRLLEERYWHRFVQPNITKEEIEAKKYSHHKKSFVVRTAYWVNKNVYSSAGLAGPLLVFVVLRHLDIFLWIYAFGFTAFWALLFLKQTREIYIKNL